MSGPSSSRAIAYVNGFDIDWMVKRSRVSPTSYTVPSTITMQMRETGRGRRRRVRGCRWRPRRTRHRGTWRAAPRGRRSAASTDRGRGSVGRLGAPRYVRGRSRVRSRDVFAVGLLVSVAAGGSLGCGSDDDAEQTAPRAPSATEGTVEGVTWTLTELNGESAAEGVDGHADLRRLDRVGEQRLQQRTPARRPSTRTSSRSPIS